MYMYEYLKVNDGEASAVLTQLKVNYNKVFKSVKTEFMETLPC